MAKHKETGTNSSRGTISQKVISSAKKILQRKVINLSEWRDAKINAENLEETVISQERLSKFDPVHGVYVYGQNTISLFIEQLGALSILSKLNNLYADANDEYMPSGPPMSPLTASYFTCWGFFDLCAGEKKETLGTVTIDFCKFLGIDKGLIHVFERMQSSRMGIYVHEGSTGRYVLLRELITNKEIKAIVPSGYIGSQGEIWYVRIMPPPFDDARFEYSVVFTTPYLLGEFMSKIFFRTATEKSWLSFFERNMNRVGIDDKESAYEYLMKYGLETNYWNEYIFLAYVNHQHNMILLAGFPDIPSSLPHSKEYEK